MVLPCMCQTLSNESCESDVFETYFLSTRVIQWVDRCGNSHSNGSIFKSQLWSEITEAMKMIQGEMSSRVWSMKSCQREYSSTQGSIHDLTRSTWWDLIFKKKRWAKEREWERERRGERQVKCFVAFIMWAHWELEESIHPDCIKILPK